MCIELAMEAREGPDPEDKAEFHMAATGHLFQNVMATCHPPGIPDEVTSGPYDTFGRLHQQCVHDPWRCGSTLASSVLQCHHLQHMCIVLAWEAREGPNTQGQAGRFMAETGIGHVPMVLTAITTDGSKVQGFLATALRTDPTTVNTQWGAQHDCMLDSTVYLSGEGIRCRPHRRDLTSMFMTFGDVDKICPLQLFRIVTFFVTLFRQRNTRALCWPCKHARVRTLRTKLGVSRQRLATSSKSHQTPGIAEKVPVRSCRECHRKTAEHHFVDKQ